MNKLICIALLSFTLCDLMAQQNPWSVAVKGGVNMSSLSVDDNDRTYSLGTGYQIGVAGSYTSGKFRFQPEFILSQQMARVKADGESLDFHLRYFLVPLVAQYEIVPGLFVGAGPQFGFLSCAKSEYHPVTRSKYEEQVYTKAYKKMDGGVVAGAAWQFANGLLFDARYYLGLTDISNFEGVAPTRTRSFQISVGYRFKFK